MRTELKIARCGLACALCGENARCGGCGLEGCPDAGSCENRRCSMEKGVGHCYECPEEGCRKGMLSNPRIFGFSAFARKYGEERLLSCLIRNEAAGVRYHRDGLKGDYDGVPDLNALFRFILEGK